MTALKDIVFETDRHWVKRVPKGFEVYKTGLTHSTRVARIGYTGEPGLQRAKQEIARREGSNPASHATKKTARDPAATFTVHGHIQNRDGTSSAFWTRTGLSKEAALKLAKAQRAEQGGVAEVVGNLAPVERAHATMPKKTPAQLDREIAAALSSRDKPPYTAPKTELTPRQINAIVRAADGRNIYLVRTRLGDQTVQRITRARTKGRETEVRALATGNWIPVLPELGDKLEVR